jgi:hypothetical protein
MIKPALLEKAIAILLLLWSVFILYSIYAALKAYVDVGILHWRDVSLTGILAMAHYRVIIPVFSIAAAVMLLAGKRSGRIACMTMLFVNAVFVCISVYSSDNVAAPAQSVYIKAALIALAFTGMGILLLQTETRVRREKQTMPENIIEKDKMP